MRLALVLACLAAAASVGVLSASGARAVPPAAPPDGSLLPRGSAWTLVFADEFRSNRVNDRVWRRCYPASAPDGCTSYGNRELEWYRPDDVVQEGDGLLRLRAQQRSFKASDGRTYPYTSGTVNTFGSYDFTYGYAEIRARIPQGRGFWPAFWLLPADRSPVPEIDVLEILGHQPNRLWMSLHYPFSRGDGWVRRIVRGVFNGPNFADGFHTYGIAWRPYEVVWYVDGRKRATARTGVPHVPMYLILNLAVGGDWPGTPSTDTRFPSTFDVDWVRVFRET